MTAPTLPSDYPIECPICGNADPARLAPWNMSKSGLDSQPCILCRECGATFALTEGWTDAKSHPHTHAG